MFKRKTVFIVGAGGSKELGFPMGDDLKYSIAEKVKFAPSADGQPGGDRRILEAIRLLETHGGRKAVPDYMSAGWAIADAMPQAISIDNFLHTHSARPEIVSVGKLGIAASILDAERASPLYLGQPAGRRLNFAHLPRSWHSTFCKMLLENVQKSDLDDLFENVSFITFNYDRCIEHYLVHALRNYLLLTAKDAEELVSRLLVIHPYGHVGKLPWQSLKRAVKFGADFDGADLLAIASQVRTFTQRIDDDAMMERIRGILYEAQTIVCLGFSYGSMNLKLLEVGPTPSGRQGPSVLGTSFMISNPNVAVLSRKLGPVFGMTLGSYPELEPLTCNELLENYWLRLAG